MIKYDSWGYEQVNKTKARNLFNKGVTVYLIPNKCRFEINGAWVRPHGIHNGGITTLLNVFDELVNAFEYYNCINELGNKARYFIKI